MPVTQVVAPFSSYFEVDGQPLEDGFIYIGAVNSNPLIDTNLIQVYSDPLLTTPLAQPIRTSGGYPVRSGTPVRIFTNSVNYSIAVLDRNRTLVYSLLDNTSPLLSTSIEYPITPFETLALVTIVNKYELPGVLDRYGTNTVPGSTDMTAAWAAADAQSAQGGAPIYIKRVGGGYAFANQISVDYRSDVVAEKGAFITYTGSANNVFLSIGDTTHTAQFRNYYLPRITRANQSDWSTEASVGVRFYSVSDSRIESQFIGKFCINMQVLPTGGLAFAHNDIFPGTLGSGKIQLDLSNATNGSANENNWYQGRFTMFQNPNPTLAAYGIRVTSSDAVYISNNNNVFIKPSFELGATLASAERLPILMVYGVQNHFWKCRNEDNDAPFVRESNAASENTYDIGYSDSYGLPIIECNSSVPNYLLTSSRTAAFDQPARKIFDSGPMHKRICYYDGGTNTHIPSVSLARSSDATVYTNLANLDIGSNYVAATASGNGVAIFIDTSVVKQFLVVKDVEAGFGGRIVVNCYDAAGAVISTADSIKGTLAQPFSSSATYGNCFTTGSDSDEASLFTVASAVKSIRVILAQGTAALRIRSFAVYAVNTHSHASSWVGYEEMVPGGNIGTAAPTAGTWAKGHIVWKADVAAGGSPGWVCTTAGSPGTWKAMANVAA